MAYALHAVAYRLHYPGVMQTMTAHNRLDTLLRRIKHRPAYDLALPALVIMGLAMASASIVGA